MEDSSEGDSCKALSQKVNPEGKHQLLPPKDIKKEQNQVTTCRELLNITPVVFAILLTFVLYTIYVGFHCLRLDFNQDSHFEKQTVRKWIHLGVFHLFFLLFSTSYILVMITSPGTIPHSREWTDTSCASVLPAEKKIGGERRFCKWCGKYKPDRTHHCRQCRRCILKMDHHCPWIYNCVGWGNHKYFFLTLFYASITCFFMSVTQYPSVVSAFQNNYTHFEVVYLLLFGEIVSIFMGVLCFGFFCFHVFLVTQNLSNIEFSEKQSRYHGSSKNPFNYGLKKNIQHALGPHVLFYLLPFDNRLDDGIHFKANISDENLLSPEK